MNIAIVDTAKATPLTVNVDSEVLELSSIRCDVRAQPREHLNTAIIETYAEDMAGGAVFPPLTAFRDDTGCWLADGFHRRYAAMSLGLVEFRCDVHAGGLREAILFSCQVNASHGVQRTSEDKRRAVMKLLQDDEWSHWSDREISRRARVSHELVRKLRPSSLVPGTIVPAAVIVESRTFKTKHGTVATMNTAAIGRVEKPAPRRVEHAPPIATPQQTQIPARSAPTRGREAICARAREAIMILSGLPPAHEVAAWFVGSDAASIISEHVGPASSWLADFNDAWKDD